MLRLIHASELQDKTVTLQQLWKQTRVPADRSVCVDAGLLWSIAMKKCCSSVHTAAVSCADVCWLLHSLIRQLLLQNIQTIYECFWWSFAAKWTDCEKGRFAPSVSKSCLEVQPHLSDSLKIHKVLRTAAHFSTLLSESDLWPPLFQTATPIKAQREPSMRSPSCASV